MRSLCEDMEHCGSLRRTYGQPGPHATAREMGPRECRLRLQSSSSFWLTIYRKKCVAYLCYLLSYGSRTRAARYIAQSTIWNQL